MYHDSYYVQPDHGHFDYVQPDHGHFDPMACYYHLPDQPVFSGMYHTGPVTEPHMPSLPQEFEIPAHPVEPTNPTQRFAGHFNGDGTYHYDSDNTDRDPETKVIVRRW